MPTPNIKERPVTKMVDPGTTEPESQVEETKPKKFVEEPTVLKDRAEFVTKVSKEVKAFGELIKEAIDANETGNPYYGNLKFMSIRIERMLLSLDEMKRGKPSKD